MTVADSRSTGYHMTRKNEGTELINRMPEAFSDFDEGHKYWEIVMKRSAHFIHTAAAMPKEGIQIQDRTGDDDEGIFGVQFGSVIHRSFPSVLSESIANGTFQVCFRDHALARSVPTIRPLHSRLHEAVCKPPSNPRPSDATHPRLPGHH